MFSGNLIDWSMPALPSDPFDAALRKVECAGLTSLDALLGGFDADHPFDHESLSPYVGQPEAIILNSSSGGRYEAVLTHCNGGTYSALVRVHHEVPHGLYRSMIVTRAATGKIRLIPG